MTSEPACGEIVPEPVGGYRDAREGDLDERDPCQYCFPEAESVDEIDVDLTDLIAGVGPYADSIHRHEDTGEIEHAKTDQGGVGEIALKIGDPDFGFDDLDKAGGDA